MDQEFYNIQTITITHNLGYIPTVQFSSGDCFVEVVPSSLTNISNDVFVVTFTNSTTGTISYI
jgi:hypothetical protein